MRTHHGSDRSQMEAAIDLVERLVDRLRVGDIGLGEFGLPGQVVAVSAREIVENPDRVAFVQQRLHQMRADEPGSAGHEKTSHPMSLNRLRERYLAWFSAT